MKVYYQRYLRTKGYLLTLLCFVWEVERFSSHTVGGFQLIIAPVLQDTAELFGTILSCQNRGLFIQWDGEAWEHAK